MHALMIIQYFSNDGYGLFNFFRRCIISDGNIGQPSDMGALADIFHTRVDNFFIGDGYQMSGQGSDPGAAKAHFLDHTVLFINQDALADLKGFIKENGQGTEKIGNRILGRQGNRNSTDSQRGQQRTDFNAGQILDD